MEMRHLPLAGAVFLIAAVSLLVSAEDPAEWPFYKLSLQWPPSVCNIQSAGSCIQNIPNQFTIHGLWPQTCDDEGVFPYRCYRNRKKKCTNKSPTQSTEIETEIAPIKSDLDKNWPNLVLRKNKAGKLVQDNLFFWRHEWEDHGMCSDYATDLKGFFQKTLDLANKYNPLQVSEIKPGGEFLLKDFANYVEEKWWKRPQIDCNYNTNTKKLQLKEIRFCFARKNLAIQDCPNVLSGQCEGKTPSETRITLPSASK